MKEVTLEDLFPALPVYEIKKDELPISIVDLLVRVGFAKSKSDARRQIKQGAIKLSTLSRASGTD